MSYIPNSTDPSTNARFTDMGANTISEMMAPQIQFFYDPTTQQARAIFSGQPYLEIANNYHSLVAVFDALEVDFSNKMGTCYGAPLETLVDPVTGADLTKVSVAGIMMLVKTAYDQEYNARADAVTMKVAAASAAAMTANNK